jgi:hypothetical protein
MRVVGRYFAIGASLGSVTGLVSLVLVWGWMTIHFGLFGFLVGWIPAGLIAAALWLIMVALWGPLLIVGMLVAVGLLAWSLHSGRDRHWRDWREPPVAAEPEDGAAPPTEPSADGSPPPAPPGLGAAQAPPADAAPAPATPNPGAPPPSAPTTSPSSEKPAPRAEPPAADDLGGDAAAAGDTSRRGPP